jgi:hypothetical protein
MKLAAGIWLVLVGCGDQLVGPRDEPPPALAFAAPTVMFPDTVIEHLSAATSIAVMNVSSDPVTPTFAVTAGADFGIERSTCDLLLPGASCTVDVHFEPHVLGGRTAELVATASGTSVATALAGVALPEPGLRSSPTSVLDYEDVAVGATKTLRIVVENGSAVTGRRYSLALAGANAADFTIAADTCSGSVPLPGATCTIDVTFAPKATTPRSAQLVVSSANLGNLMIALAGQGFRPAELAVTPESGMFGSVFVFGHSMAQSFTVTNSGTVPSPTVRIFISGPNAQQFSLTDGCSGLMLAGGASCVFSIVYYAPASAGTSEATATVFAGSLAPLAVPLTGTGEPAQLKITPSGVNFGDVFLGQTSDVKTLTVENTGSSTTGILTTTLWSINSDVAIVDDACTGVDLAPAATCTVAVNVTPTLQYRGGASVVISAPRGDTAIAPMQYRGILPATLIAAPGAAAFGDVQLTETPRQVFTVTNVGDLDTGAMAVTIAGDDAADVSLVENCTGRSLPLLFSCSLTVSFSPSHLGAETARIEITSPGATLTIPIDANVLPAPLFTVSPDAVVVNPVAVGEPHPLTFVVEGTGSATGPLTVQVTGPNAADYATTADNCSGTTLASGQACTITLTLTPSGTGSRTATLVVAGEPGGYRKVALTGIAFTQAALAISQPSITFAATGIGQTNEFGFLTIKNTGQLPTGTLTAQLVGQDPGEFLVFADTCTGAVLAANAECSVHTYFTPTRIATSTATLVVSGAPGGMVTASLTGTGLAPPVISSPITALEFAPQETFTIIGAPVRIDNVGGSPTDELHATLTGPQADAFTADDYHCSNIAAGSRCDVQITFHPTAVGQASATLVVESTLAGTVTVALTGTATAGTKVIASPDSYDFGFVPGGEFSPVQSFIATNIGQRDVAKFHTYVAGPPGCDNFSVVATTCGSTLGPSASCRVDVVFHPLTPISSSCRLVFLEDSLLKGEAELLGQSAF